MIHEDSMSIQELDYYDAKTLFHENFEDHVREVYGADAKVNINETLLLEAAVNNNIVMLGIKDQDTYIGYMSFYITQQHHTGKLVAVTDCFYIKPQYRGVKSFNLLVQAFKDAEKLLLDEFNCDDFYVVMGVNLKSKAFISKLGLQPADIVYKKELKG